GFGRGEDFGREAGLGGHAVEPFLLEEPVAVTAFFPFAQMAGSKILAVFAEALNDIGIRQTIEDHLIDLLAGGFGEAGDFAVATSFKLEERVGGVVGLGGWFGCRCRIENLRFWIHGNWGGVKK